MVFSEFVCFLFHSLAPSPPTLPIPRGPWPSAPLSLPLPFEARVGWKEACLLKILTLYPSGVVIVLAVRSLNLSVLSSLFYQAPSLLLFFKTATNFDRDGTRPIPPLFSLALLISVLLPQPPIFSLSFLTPLSRSLRFILSPRPAKNM